MREEKSTESKILQAAMEVFIKKGRHGARMQEIADRAGINKALLHYYFRNKENLYTTIFKTVYINFFMEMERVFQPELPPAEQLRAIIHRYIDILNADEKVPLFLARELSEGGDTVKRIVSESLEQNQLHLPHFMIRFLDKARSEGEIRKIDPTHFIMTLLGSSVFFFIAEPVLFTLLQKPDPFDRDRFIADRKDAIFDVLYFGIKPRIDEA